MALGPQPIPGAGGATDQDASSVWQSSLDLVYSYSRSTAFYSQNLPSAPSFVDLTRPSDEEEGVLSESATSGEEGDDSGEDDEEGRGIDGEIDVDPLASQAHGKPDGQSQISLGDEPSTQAQKSPAQSPPLSTQSETQVQPAVRVSSPRTNGILSSPSNSPPDERTTLLSGKTRPGNQRQYSGTSGSGGFSGVSFAQSTGGEGNGARRRSSANNRLRRKSSSPGEALEQEEEQFGLSSISHVSGRGPREEHSFPGPAGSSTYGQTLFNSINVLVGVGILAEPLAFAYAGWVGGSILLLFCGVVTNYTAKILAKLMYEDPSLLTYVDIGTKAFGKKAQVGINALFCLEVLALSVALVVLFGDTLSSLLGLSPTIMKIIGFVVILPTIFMPLRLLSFTSLIGIISSFALVIVLLIDGFIKSEAPGSLRDPLKTDWAPDWKAAPLSAGLIMSGFSGHAVMPSLARDLKDRHRFNSMINWAYVVSGAVYSTMGVAGYLMFSRGVKDEVTRNLIETPGYPIGLTKAAVWMIGINPLAKFALAFRPLSSALDHAIGLESPTPPAPPPPPSRRRRSTKNRQDSTNLQDLPASGSYEDESAVANYSSISNLLASDPPGGSSFTYPGHSTFSQYSRRSFLLPKSPKIGNISKFLSKFLLAAFITLVAVVFPGFDRVMSFLGSFSAFVICVIGPLTAYLIIWKGRISRTELIIDWILVILAVVLAGFGTVFTFLPSTGLPG